MTGIHRRAATTLAALSVAMLAAAVLPASTALAMPLNTSPANVPFASAIFKATHNSYSGGKKKSIAYQLDHGVRFIEYDVQDNGYDTNRDYAVGHDEPGNQVDHNGNPASNALHDWLNVVNTWSGQHRDHVPVVLMLDIKDNLTDNPNFAAGNLAALNAELVSIFGAKLAQAKDYPGNLPSIDAMRGRILVLLSGANGTRTFYKRDIGHNPSVAVNKRGQVVEVHDSGDNQGLWYWTGQLGADGRITWLRHGKYDDGLTPAVALNDDSTLVEVHRSQSHTTLWQRVGHLDANGEISWSNSAKYDDGVQPTVAFTSTNTVREIHKSPGNDQNWTWNGAVSAQTVKWTGNAKTADARYNKSVSGQVSVSTGADGPTPPETLRYSTGKVSGDRIRYQQVAFVEFQDGESAELRQGALFYAAPATNSAFMVASRKDGHIVRGWDFDDKARATTPLANYPATNDPWSSWYQDLTTAAQ